MGIDKIRGIEGFGVRGRGTGFVALSALVACTWIAGCGGESGDDGDNNGGSAGTSTGKGGSSSGNGGSAGSSSGNGGTSNGGTSNGGGGGTAGTSVTGGTGGTAGGTAGNAGDDGNAGEDGNAGGNGNAGGEAAGGSAGEDTGGTNGDAGEGNTGGVGEGGTGGAEPVDPTVRGRLIDFYGHPLPGVTVGIGTTEVITNAQGEFVIEDAPEVYDASFVVETPNPRKVYGWVFQGLTRRDPTLQAVQAINERTLNTNWYPEDGAPTATQNLTVAIGSEHGSWQARNIPANGRASATCTWAGPATTAANAHALMWSYDDDTDLPTNYVSYTTFPFALDDAASTQTTQVSVAATTINQANIGGTVTDMAEVGRTNYGFVRFTSGATIDLFEDTSGPNTFSYLVPELPNGSVTFAALDEDWSTYEYSLVYQDGVTPGTTSLALTIPATASLTAPPNDTSGETTVNDTTEFRYQNRQPGVGAVVVRIEDDMYQQGIYVVTASNRFTIPAVLQGGFALRINGIHFWQVEAHGTYATVDDMASADGYVSPFRSNYYSPEGPRTGSGTLTMTARRYFTYQP